MRSLFLVLLLALPPLLVVAPLSAFAAETYRANVTAVPGSVTFTVDFTGTTPFDPIANGPVPTSLPFSFSYASCNTRTMSAEIVNGGLEVELVAENGCDGTEPALSLMLEMIVPELGGTATMVRLNTVPIVTDFPPLASVFAMQSSPGGEGTTTSVEGAFDTQFGATDWNWQADQAPYPRPPTELQRMIPLIPGDTVRFPFNVYLRMDDGSSFVGTLRMRYEFLVTVPELSSALSLPIGALTLIGLASLRG